MRPSRFAACAAVLAGGLAAQTPPAGATDVGATRPPARITDQRVSIGPRTLHLGPGEWIYFADEHSPIAGGPRKMLTESLDSALLVRLAGDRLELGLRLMLLRHDLEVTGWKPQPCGGTRYTLYASEHGAPSWFMDCVSVDGVRPGQFDDYIGNGLTQRWMREQHLQWPGPAIGIRYTRTTQTTYGTLRLLLPTDSFESDAEAQAWAEGLREALRPMFEHRVDEARLPALPLPRPASAP
jgi:hypothetical protein